MGENITRGGVTGVIMTPRGNRVSGRASDSLLAAVKHRLRSIQPVENRNPTPINNSVPERGITGRDELGRFGAGVMGLGSTAVEATTDPETLQPES